MPTIIHLYGELDYSRIEAVSTQLKAAVQCSSTVIVNLSRLRFLDCSGLGVITAARKLARDRGGDLILEDPQGIVRRLLLILEYPFRE